MVELTELTADEYRETTSLKFSKAKFS